MMQNARINSPKLKPLLVPKQISKQTISRINELNKLYCYSKDTKRRLNKYYSHPRAMKTKPKKVNTTRLPPVKRFLYSHVARLFLPYCFKKSKCHEGTCISEHSPSSLESVMTHKYRGSQQSSREVKPKFIDSTQGETKDIYKP
jgi:hypothetical protein